MGCERGIKAVIIEKDDFVLLVRRIPAVERAGFRELPEALNGIAQG
jgi:hypothetical protein